MLRRNLIIVFKPIKSNSVILSETNHRLMNLSVSSSLRKIDVDVNIAVSLQMN